MFFIAALLIVGIVLQITSNRAYGSVRNFLSFLGNSAISVAVILSVVSLLITNPISLNTISTCESFQDRNQEMFIWMVSEYPDAATITTQDDSTQMNKLSYEYAKKVMDHNDTVLWYRKYQEHWFIGFFVGKMPDEVGFIKLPQQN
jgi:hypothetical protein